MSKLIRCTAFSIRCQGLGHVQGVYTTEEAALQNVAIYQAEEDRLFASRSKNGAPRWVKVVPVSIYLTDEQAKALGLSEATHACELPVPPVEKDGTLAELAVSGVGRVDL